MGLDQQTTHIDIRNGEEKEVHFLTQPSQSNYRLQYLQLETRKCDF